MASQYLQQLTAVTSISGSYLLPASDDPSGSGRLKKATFSQVLDYIESAIDSSTNPMTINNILISDRSITNSVFVGGSAGALVTSGAYNVIVGKSAGRTFTDASYNSFFGGYAGENVTGGSNTLIGAGSAGTLTSGTECVIIGTFADTATATDNNSIVIGKSAVGLGSNTTVIGNSNTTSTKLFGTVTAGNVVITNPATSATLTIADGTTLTGNQNVSTTGSPQFSSLGVGTAATSTALIETALNYTDPSTTSISGLRVSSSSNIITSNNANVLIGNQCTLRLDQNGFNATASTASLRGASNTVYGYGSSGAITLVTGYYAQVGNVGAGTVTTATGFHVAAGQNSGGGTLTNNVGFNVASQTSGTNIYGFRGQIASTSGRWNLYMEGTAANYIAGQLSIGSTTLTAKLSVLETTEQLRLLYDASNYFSTTVSSAGAVTFDAVGSGSAFTYNDPVNIASTSNTVTPFRVTKSYTDPSTTAIGVYINSLSNTLTADNSSAIIGEQCFLRLDAGGFNATGDLRGYSCAVYGSGAGTLSFPSCFYAQTGNLGSGTVTTAIGFHVAAGQNSGGGTLTNNIGFNVVAQTAGTNIYGFRGQIASSSGRWNLYMVGTAANYLAGQISIGTTTLTAKAAILDTAEQLRLLYDASNYVSFTVSSTGALTLDSVGSAPKFTFSDNVGFGTSTFGTSAAGGVIALSNSMTAPSSSPTDITQIYCADSAAANANIFVRNENGKIERLTGLCSRVSTQFDKTSSTTLGDVTGLSINVEAGRTYIFEAFLMTTSTTNGGVKAAISGTATATSIRYTGETTSGSTLLNSRATALGTAVGAITSITNPDITIKGTITVNAAGTLTVQFAQNASHTDTSSVLTGSYFKIQSTGD